MQFIIRQANKNDVDQIRFLFQDTITFINSKDYNEKEIEIWAENHKNVERWIKKISEQYFIVAEADNQVVGFSSITDTGYLDFMYVHKDFQRQGIAKKLLTEIEKHADKLLLKKIFSHVSITARVFLKKMVLLKPEIILTEFRILNL